MSEIIHGNNIEILRTFPDNSIDSIVTDPPYGLSFMNKHWDYDVPSVELWRECLRVLKPGGHLLSFAGTRTYHRMTVRIEDAGFEIRDMISYIYGQGFPKSLNIKKALEKEYEKGLDEVAGSGLSNLPENISQEENICCENEGTLLQSQMQRDKAGTGLEEVGKSWSNDSKLATQPNTQGQQGGQKSSLEGRSNLQEGKGELYGCEICKMPTRIFRDGKERRVYYGTQISNGKTPEQTINENGSSSPRRPQPSKQQNRKFNVICEQCLAQAIRRFDGFGTSLKPACEPICVARKPIPTTVAENVLKYGTGGLNIDGCRIPSGKEHFRGNVGAKITESDWKNNSGFGKPFIANDNPAGRFPANIIFDEISSVLLDEMSGESKSSNDVRNKNGTLNKGYVGDFGLKAQPNKVSGFNDKGGASRFFMNIKKDIADDFLSCYLCANDIKKEICQEKNKPVQNVKKNLQNTEVTTEFTVQKNVTGSLNDKLVLLVSNAENLCDLCVMNFVQNLVLISESPKGVQSPEVLQAIQDFTTNYKNYTLLQSLVYCVEQMANIDITPTTQNLLKLFGSVFRVIENYTKKDTRGAEALKSAPVRFQYVAKASKAERNGGLDGFEGEVRFASSKESGKMLPTKTNEPHKVNGNFHPTVKPLKLMQYLVRLVTPPKGICLDPFAGSGTTGMACEKEDFDYILCEREAEYIPIIKARIEWIKKQKKEIPEQTNLFKPL